MVWANVKERSHLLNKYGVEGGMYSCGWGLGQMGGSCENVCMGSINFGGISWVAKEQLASQQGLRFMKSVDWSVPLQWNLRVYA